MECYDGVLDSLVGQTWLVAELSKRRDSIPDKWLRLDAMPMSDAMLVSAAAGDVDKAHARYAYLAAVYDQNTRLLDENCELVKLMVQLSSKRREIKRDTDLLSRMVDFRQEHTDLTLLSARIIPRETSPFSSVSRIRLDRGDADQVSADQPVVTAAGIVGRIEKVAGEYCDVMLLTDSRSRIDVQIPGKSISGTLMGTGDSLPVFRFPYQKSQLAKGDVLITTGHDRLFTKGLVAGYVATADVTLVGMHLEVEVDPGVQLSSLRYVFVVK